MNGRNFQGLPADGVDDSPNAVEAITRVNVTVSPNLDAVQEFKIQSGYDARFGHTVGGVINITSKSGTNELHGTFYDYLRMPR